MFSFSSFKIINMYSNKSYWIQVFKILNAGMGKFPLSGYMSDCCKFPSLSTGFPNS